MGPSDARMILEAGILSGLSFPESVTSQISGMVAKISS